MFTKSNLSKVKHALTALFLGTVVLTGCSKDDDDQPLVSVSLEQSAVSISQSGEATVKLVASSNVTQDVVVPFSTSGSAVAGTDYKLSAESFVIKAGTSFAEVKIETTPSFNREKSIKVELGTLPQGITAGTNLSAIVAVNINDVIIYTFQNAGYSLSGTAEIRLNLSKVTGTYTAEKEMRIPVEVDASSTAIEGTHFAFEGAKEVVIPAGKSFGVVKLKRLKSETGKNTVSLKVGALSSVFVAGDYAETVANILPPTLDKIVGTWKFKAFANIDWLILNIGSDDAADLPTKNSAADLLTFGEDGMTPQMTGDMKNYFRKATIKDLGEETERLQEVPGFPAVTMQRVKVSAANVAFSASKQEIREADMGFRIYEEDGKEILEVTLIDYEPVDFLANTLAVYKTFASRPYFRYNPIRYHFERVK